jgi:hypothetical protein
MAPPSLRATGSRECAPDDRLREAIHLAAKKVWIASSHPPSPEGGLRQTGALLAMTTGDASADRLAGDDSNGLQHPRLFLLRLFDQFLADHHVAAGNDEDHG